MSLELTPDLNQGESSSPQFPVTGWWRIWQGLFVIALPSFSFWAIQFLEPEWQSGELPAYLALFLQPAASIFFLFLLAYSVISYLLLLIDSDHYAPLFAVRCGVYTGVLLALQYSVSLFLYILDERYSFAIFLVWFFPLYYPGIHRWAISRWSQKQVNTVFFFLALIAFAVTLYIYKETFLPVFLVAAGLVMAAPFWSFLMAGSAAIWLYKNHETKLTLPRGFGIVGWIASYGVAWRYDILKMYGMYAQLPTAPPDCYIATAAARGHPNFVRSWTVRLANGTSLQVNSQLKILKCAELALMALAPQVHKPVRKLYDRLGKPLALRIQHPLVADCAYLLMKPVEWLAGFVLMIVIPGFDGASIYN